MDCRGTFSTVHFDITSAIIVNHMISHLVKRLSGTLIIIYYHIKVTISSFLADLSK